MPLAVARNAITELRELMQRKTAFGFNRPLRERAVVQTMLARAEGMLRAARLLYYDTMERAWERTLAGMPHTLEHKADLQLAAAHATATAATVADMMHRAAGTTGIYARSPLERHFRDAQTLRHHGCVSLLARATRFPALSAASVAFLAENPVRSGGQVYSGVEPEFWLIGF